jgi:hypothetical protein
VGGFEDDAPDGGDAGPAPQDGKTERAVAFVNEVVGKMGLAVAATLVSDNSRQIEIDIAGADASALIGKRGGISLVVGQVELTLIDALVQSGRISREGQGEVLVYRVVRQHAHTAQPVRAAASPASRPLAKCAKAVRVAQETPLQWLARRKDKAGQPMLSPTAQAAGERLQQDFMQAGMSPKMSADWSGLPASGFGNQGGGLLPGERQMAARQRLRLALDACGGELAGVLLDLCCFLKPLETVEHERGWPARSGKVILKLALSALMRHYGVSENAQGPARSHKTHIWHAPARQPD